jgi:hypothetical protein
MSREIILTLEKDSFGIIVIGQHMISADLYGDLSALKIVEVVSVRLSSLYRIEEDAHSQRVCLRSLPPVKYHTYTGIMRMVDTKFLMPA